MNRIKKSILMCAFLPFASNAELLVNGGFESSPLTDNEAEYFYPHQGVLSSNPGGVTEVSNSEYTTTQPDGNVRYESWDYSGGSVVVNGTGINAWYGSIPPGNLEGNNFAVLQSVALIQQTFELSNDRNLNLTWFHRVRSLEYLHSYKVKINDAVINSFFSSAQLDFEMVSINNIYLEAGTHTLSFEGISSGFDASSFIDNISMLESAQITSSDVPYSSGYISLFLFLTIIARRRYF